MSFDRDINIFIEIESAERGWSPHTREAYRRDVVLYSEFLLSLGLSTFAATTRDAVLEFLKMRLAAGDGPRTRNRRLAALRTLHRHLYVEGVLKKDLVPFLPSPRREHHLPHYLSQAEMDELLRVCQLDKKTPLRLLALVEILYATGIRASELCSLTPGNLLVAPTGEVTLRVLGKGGKERTVPVHGSAARSLMNYLRNERPHLTRPESGDNLFLTERGISLERTALYRILRNLGLKAGIRQRVTPHLLRHTFATHLVHGGADLRSVQEMLGHSNLATTTIYTSVDAERLRDIHRSFHPRG